MHNDISNPVLITSLEGHTVDLSDPYSIQNHAKRLDEYSNIGQQLNLLYDDIQSGMFGEAAKSGKFAQHVSLIKQKYPVVKPGI
jgi:hypothetical protein